MTSTNKNMASPAAKAVYETTELLESILKCLPASDVLRLSSVDQRTHKIIHRSPEVLHDFIFEKPKTATRLELNPLLPAFPVTPNTSPNGRCFCCCVKSWWSPVPWIAEVMHRRPSKFGVHFMIPGSITWDYRLQEFRSSAWNRQGLEQSLRNVWHVRLDYLQRLANCRAKSSSWKNIWLSADKEPVEVHILEARGFRCFYVRTLQELVQWGVPWHGGHVSDQGLKWRLQMFGTPEKVIEELGLQNVDAVAPHRLLAVSSGS